MVLTPNRTSRELRSPRIVVAMVAMTMAMSATAFAQSTQYPTWRIAGIVPGGRFGYAVANVGDLDGDLVDDLLVGAPTGATESPDSPPAPIAPGNAVVLSGKTGATIFTLQGAGVGGDLFGYAVANLGDTNLDGVNDFGVGAARQSSQFNPAAGSLSVYSGATGALRYRIFGDGPNDYFGTAVAGLGDINLDGIVDFVVGAPFADPNQKVNSGRIKVCVGSTGGTLKTVNGQFAGDLFGTAIAATSDFTNDLNDDFVVGAPLAMDLASSQRLGRVSFYEGGGTFFAKVNGLSQGDRFGRSVSSIPDFDGDGKNDVVVGAIGADGAVVDTGAVTIVSTKQLTPVLFTKFGAQSNASYGIAQRGVADLNQDNVPDLLVTDVTGRLQIVSGTGTQLGVLTGPGGFGRSITIGGDASGDGVADLVLGSPTASSGGIDQAGTLESIPGPTLIGSAAIDDASPLNFSIALGTSVAPVVRKLIDTGFSAVDFDVVVPQNAPWLVVNPKSGALSGFADTANLTFALDLGKLPYATTNTTVNIVNHVSGKTMVSLLVNVAPTSAGANSKVDASPASLYAVAPFSAAPPAPAVIEVSNAGNPALLLAGTVHIEPPSATWLVPQTTAFEIAANEDSEFIEVDYATSGLAPGTYQASVVVANAFDSNDAVSIPVTVVVGASLFVPGDRLKGTLADASDRDEAVFLGFAGLAVEFIGGPKNSGAAPHLSLIDPDGLTVDAWSPANSKAKKGFLLAKSGPFTLRVESENGSVGAFDIKTKRDGLPASAKSFKKTVTVDSSQPLDLPLAALPNCELTAKITSTTLPIGQLAFALKAPSGASFDVTQYDALGTKSYSLVKVPLAVAGTWHVVVNGLAPGAKLKLDFGLKQPKVGKSTLTID